MKNYINIKTICYQNYIICYIFALLITMITEVFGLEKFNNLINFRIQHRKILKDGEESWKNKRTKNSIINLITAFIGQIFGVAISF